jgi:ABC-type siderophore export system fused ATPase/permease subunit
MLAGCGPALSMINDDPASERAQLAIKKVTKIVETPEGKEFPQTSTVFQWYELEEFETYRHLGYLMG